jgi:hypothetical protein
MEIRARNMNINRIQENFSNRVEDGSAIGKFYSGARVAVAREVMPVLCTMRRPQGLFRV